MNDSQVSHLDETSNDNNIYLRTTWVAFKSTISSCRKNYAIVNMRTYEDTFSGEKIYPGKVREPEFCDDAAANDWDGQRQQNKGNYNGEKKC